MTVTHIDVSGTHAITQLTVPAHEPNRKILVVCPPDRGGGSSSMLASARR
jgi:hypothetical protein